MAQHPIDFLEVNLPGKIAMMPCPGTKEADLLKSVADIASNNISAVLTLTPSDELEMLKADELPELCRTNDIDWFHLPIVDDQAPTIAFHNAWQNNGQKIMAHLKGGKNIALHCQGGTGRTGLVAAIILLNMGLSRLETEEKIKAIRPLALTIESQVAFLDAFFD